MMFNISIIIPTYNRKLFLINAINSVLAQTYQNLELIIIDDGSSDKTAEYVKKKYPKETLNHTVNLLLNDFKNIDESKIYDVLVGLGFIEYFEEPQNIINKLYKILSKDGTLILSFPNLNSFDFSMIRLLTIPRVIAKKIFKIL